MPEEGALAPFKLGPACGRPGLDSLRFMKRRTEKLSTHPEVVRATAEQQPILENLLELYIHDFSEFHHVPLGMDGRFGYRNISLYWREPGRHPFLVRMDDKLAGFVLVKRGSEFSGNESVWDMAEFFVVRGYRRRGVGTEIAHEVWRQFPGWWEVRVMESNHSVLHFWEHAITMFTGEAIDSARFEKSGEFWHIFSFEAKAVA
jgi:predicted acetyltransferase